MLYLLTGQVQTGKTRWLQGLVSAYEARGVAVDGVLAPGVWREVTARDGAASFEKLGIDNILLPEHETIPFASRRDLAVLDGTFDAESQSARARLHWEISRDALARVNAHFEQLTREAHVKTAASLLVVDELGWLELLRGEGLSCALALLEFGPTPAYPDAIVVVRETLLPQAHELLDGPWNGDVREIAPGASLELSSSWDATAGVS